MKIFQTLQEKSSTTQVLFQKQHNSCLKPLFLGQFNKKGQDEMLVTLLSKDSPRSDFVEGKTTMIFIPDGVSPSGPFRSNLSFQLKTNVGKSATYDR